MKKITKLLMGMLFATAMTIVGCKSGDSGTFTVTFNANGGTGAPDAVTVESGTTITKPTTDPTYDGYTFNGWYTEAAATTAFDFSTSINEDTTLYAGWTANNTNANGTTEKNYTVWVKSDSEALTAGASYGQVALYNDSTNPFTVTKGDLLIISTTVAFDKIGQTYPSIGLTETGTSTAKYISIDGYYTDNKTIISSYDYYFIYRIPSTGTVHYVSFNNGSTDGTKITALAEGKTVTFTNLKIVQIPVAKISSVAQVIVDTDSTSLTASSGTYQYAPTISETTAAAGTKLFVLYTTDIALSDYKSHYLNSSFDWKATYPSGAAGAYSAAFDISKETTTNWLQIGVQNGSDAGPLTLSDVLVGIMPGISSF